jgi:penicillin-binding protein 1A
MSRALVLKVAGGFLAFLLIVAVVPPLRRAAAIVTSKVVLFVASPLAPKIADFKKLPETTKLVATDGSVVAELDKAQRRVPVKLDQLPPHVRQAVLAAEDQDFYHHGGVDPSAVMRAFVRTAQGRTQGGSTITQQLAKINYTARERTVFRKLKEVLYASQLEKKYTKDQLLERYLNQIYFGEGAYGINAAAATYFNVDASQLSPAQAAMLAGKIRSPEGLNPRKRPDAVLKRRNQVLANMRDNGWLKASEYDAAVHSGLDLQPPAASGVSNRAPHFVEYVKREAATIEALGSQPATRSSQLFTGGYTIETTFDPKVFDATVASVQQRLGSPGDPFTAVATVVPGDGAVRSLFGGLDFLTSQFDMSSNPASGRQAGSSFKPFVYLASLRKGIDPRSTYDGTSGRVIPCYDKSKPVQNYAGEDLGGKITLDEAMVHSVNVVFVEVGCKTGVRNVISTAVDDGIPADATKVQGAVFLGGLDDRGVNALEMASAFATFAAQGTYATPYGIAKIKDSSGRVIYEHKPATRPVFKPEEVGVLNGALQQVVQRGTGAAANLGGRPVAGKTGTTQDNIDGWFVGYTPQLATGVWVGYNKNEPMSNVHGRAVTGGSFPATIFGDLMRVALEGVPAKPLFVASPDQLNLSLLSGTTSLPPTSSTSSTSSTAVLPGAVTTLPPTPASTQPIPPGRTTTTRPPAPTTTTTAKPPPSTTTSTTTSPPPTTTTTTTTKP